ncbi:MAG: hypothetical protein ACYC45_03515 [Acidithiobacillus ferriphilus]|uniref:hypothetical protein n=1 Tax=Acidithiobacillus ferriphilus TaxID=1689834 RepID=UPI001C073A42|nr:hypothetical protein [Acidithiobacillus ferriphilus]MBU2827495.1 hypothetical protein [Acidithiobacillus ferriphilus]MEB8474056.1 hypothetical protein [Acidithiobacillus ferriphilus]
MIRQLDVLAVLYAVDHKPMASLGEDDLLSARIQLLTDLQASIDHVRVTEAVKECGIVMRGHGHLSDWMAASHDQPLEAALRILVTAAVGESMKNAMPGAGDGDDDGVLASIKGMVRDLLAVWECALIGVTTLAAERCRRQLGRDLAAVMKILEAFGMIQKTVTILALPAPTAMM